TGTKTADKNTGTTAKPASLYDFRLKVLKKSGTYYVPDELVTTGITADVSYYNPDTLVSFSGTLWELDPVEVRARTRPARIMPHVPAPEQQVFAAEGVDIPAFQQF